MPPFAFATEEDTKTRLITPALQQAGWSVDDMLMEYSLRKDRHRIIPDRNETVREARTGPNRPDYILCRKVHQPIAVVEAKKAGLDDYAGLDQVKYYARLLDLPFAFASSGGGFVEWEAATGKERRLKLDAFPSPEELWERWQKSRNIAPEDGAKVDAALYYTTAGGWTPRYYSKRQKKSYIWSHVDGSFGSV